MITSLPSSQYEDRPVFRDCSGVTRYLTKIYVQHKKFAYLQHSMQNSPVFQDFKKIIKYILSFFLNNKYFRAFGAFQCFQTAGNVISVYLEVAWCNVTRNPICFSLVSLLASLS